ncbi:Protein O-GlcNAcase [Schistosoma japonicum]|uniref:protein O-GlcNAcase n=2 Tax=Schistosoma japonicum TaxID=6182 RepID=A0A4Z2D5N4_SCHJA|nr:Protein O-GlcNAcase [Schistosoma japonicum]
MTSENNKGIGFYGRPWTYPQRKELFRRMNQMGMNAYLYAPKDDIKHRQSWRDLYTQEEEQQLQFLITESTEAGVLFIFAISPGLDVTFSSAKEVDILKKKVDQVSKLGCRAFALLFDDIEPRLCPADREVFNSSARAQVMFANEIYNHLGCPDVFLFCPTEYSASLAVPNINKSEYLATVASCLAPGIAVIWTGPLVVSKRILTKELEELSKLLQHPIILWDNLHANDYDQRRVFIGPYSGRPLALRRKGLLRGVLTNPNCEFEANYVALHTLAQWSRQAGSRHTMQSSDTEMLCTSEDLESNTSDDNEMIDDGIDDQKSGDINEHSSVCQGDHVNRKRQYASVYRPREALRIALRDWLALMLQVGASKPSTTIGTPTPMDTDNPEAGQNEAPMQIESPPNVVMTCDNNSTETPNSGDVNSVAVTLEDLELFADLFYLPFSHGPAAIRLLELSHWLREYSYVCGPNPSDLEKATEWNKKLSDYIDMVSTISRIRDRIQRLPSKSISYELAPYITEVHTVVGIILDYFRWLETGVMAYRSMSHLKRLLTWFSPGYRDMVTSGDQEPWTFRGGLITELQRILPLESAQDLFPAPSRAVPGMTTIPFLNWPDNASNVYTSLPPAVTPMIPIQPSIFPNFSRFPSYLVRPYRPEDKSCMYSLFRKLLLARVGLPENALPPEFQDLPGDKYLLPFLQYSPENCFMVIGPPFLQNSLDCCNSVTNSDYSIPGSCVGFGVSAPDAVSWARERNTQYRESMKLKYPRDLQIGVQNLSNCSKSIIGNSETNNPNLGATTTSTARLEPPVISSAPPSPLTDDRSSTIAPNRNFIAAEEFIKSLVSSFHNDAPEVVDIAAAVNLLPPPEPLGGCLPIEPPLSGCLEHCESSCAVPATPSVLTNLSSQLEPKSPFPVECATSISPLPLPTPILPDTAPPSPPTGTCAPLVPETCSSSPATTNSVIARSLIVAGGPEAIHSALTAHPAILWIEFDDIGLNSCVSGPTPAMLINHNLGLCADSPELLLDSVARRLFICLLAALKTVGAHGAHVQLDAVNEHRAELYRRFGFYPIPAASNEQTTVLARLI